MGNGSFICFASPHLLLAGMCTVFHSGTKDFFPNIGFGFGEISDFYRIIKKTQKIKIKGSYPTVNHKSFNYVTKMVAYIHIVPDVTCPEPLIRGISKRDIFLSTCTLYAEI